MSHISSDIVIAASISMVQQPNKTQKHGSDFRMDFVFRQHAFHIMRTLIICLVGVYYLFTCHLLHKLQSNVQNYVIVETRLESEMHPLRFYEYYETSMPLCMARLFTIVQFDVETHNQKCYLCQIFKKISPEIIQAQPFNLSNLGADRKNKLNLTKRENN